MRGASALVALTLSLAACSGGETPAPEATGSPARPPTVTMQVFGLDLAKDEAAVLVIDPAIPAAGVIVSHDPAARVDVFLLKSATDAPGECPIEVGPRTNRTCVASIGTGVRESLEQRGEAGGVAVVLRDGPGRMDVRLDYDERSRRVGLRLPRLAPPAGASVCKDNGCNPFIEVTPLRSGPMTATAAFSGGPGRLQVQSGRVIAKAFTASGQPYRIPDEDLGDAPLKVSTRFDVPAEYALALINENRGAALNDIVIDATWP
ncbi:MAG TPA: hypothetical protein VM841_00790 [Actinomycetota bacterium]|nr:hypothetical protein [Actinomycetota bacterium]